MPLSLRSVLALTLTALAGLLLALGLPGPVGAVDAAKPTPCDGALFATDPEGDSEISGGFSGDDAPGPPNTDITGFFFNHRADKDGKPVLTANMVLKSLDQTVPDPYVVSGGINYYFHWISGEEYRFVKAENPGDGTISYGYGTVDDVGIYTTDGETAGAFFEGAGGIVQIDIPEAFNGKIGDKLEKVVAIVDTIEGQDDFFGFNNHADGAGSGEDSPGVNPPNGLADYTATACPAGTAPPPPSGPTPPPTTSPPTTTPPPSSGPSALPLRVPTSLGSARKAKRRKALSFKVTAGEPITRLTVKLVPQGKKRPVVGKASIASLKKGSTRIKLKVTKRLKKGVYAFTATGTVNGKRLGFIQKVSVK